MPEQHAAAPETAPAENTIEVKPAAESAAEHAKVNGSAPSQVDSNYQYWREHGGDWVDGYDQRKKRQVLYHIQELMLTQYMLQHAATAPTKPMRVLEFGCGVGRHLRNLTRLPDVDAYGYDQSPTMAAGILRWSGKQWFDSHIAVGMPTGMLPYPDKHFDIVYTAEVLVHVRPEHIDGILKELVRVCRGHILHIETSEHVPLVSDSHDGCWRHDLVAAYARLGLECQVLPSGYLAHAPYRVRVLEEPRFTWPPAILEMYRRLERDMNEGFEAAIAEPAQQAAELRHRVAGLSVALEQRSAELLAARRALEEIATSLEAQAARAGMLEGQLAEARTSEARLGAACADLRKEIAALTARAAELESLWNTERSQAQTLAEQRQTFIAEASRYLRP
jgi:SAM-dependent methyltransferase